MSGAASGTARIGRWEIASVPGGWWFVPDFGLRHQTDGDPPSNIMLTDDVLLAGNRLEPYIATQVEILRGRFTDPIFAGPGQSALFPAEECMLLMIQHRSHGALRILQVQTYVRIDRWLGIITLTTKEQNLPGVRKDYEQFVASLQVASETTGGSQT